MRSFLRSLLLLPLLAMAAAGSKAEVPASSPSGYPIDLATTLRLAGAKSIDVQIARERLEAAKANATAATLQFLPWLSAGVNYRQHGGLIQDVTGNVIEADKNSHTAGAALNLQVDLGDAIYKSLTARQARVAAEQALAVQRQHTIVRAAQAYFDLLVAQAIVSASEEALRISREYESQLHRAVDAGIALKGDELRVRVQSQRNRLALQQATEQRRVLGARLAESLRLDPGVELVAQDPELAPLALAQATEAAEAQVSEALSARPEMKEAHALTQVALESDKGATYGPLIPTVFGQAFFGTLGGGKDLGPTTSGASRDFLVAVGWRLGPGGIFDVGRTRAARARLGEATWNAEKTKDGITRQVVEARTRVLSQQEQLETAKEALSVAEQGLTLARGRREFEVGVVLENILAEQDQTRAREDYMRAIGEYDKAQYELLQALGRLAKDGPNVGAAIGRDSQSSGR